MNPADAVDAQREIAEFHRSRAGRDYLVAYFHNTRDTRAAERRELARTSPALALGMELMSRDDLEHKLDETIEEMADATSEVIDLSLRIAETFAVSEEMFDVVRTGAASIPPTMVERPDLPAERGFLLLPRPLLVPDVHGKQIGVRALVWGVTGGQVEVVAFSDMRDVDDYTAVRPQVPGVRWLVTTAWKVSLDRTIREQRRRLRVGCAATARAAVPGHVLAAVSPAVRLTRTGSPGAGGAAPVRPAVRV